MQVFEQAQRSKFEDEMGACLVRRFIGNPAAADPDKLRSWIQEGLNIAGKYGIVNRYDVQRFLEFRAEYGPDFHLLPWAAGILNDRTLSGSGKVERIDGYSLFALRPQ
jgi:hypothetical protein